MPTYTVRWVEEESAGASIEANSKAEALRIAKAFDDKDPRAMFYDREPIRACKFTVIEES